jgi:hypothetical protein
MSNVIGVAMALAGVGLFTSPALGVVCLFAQSAVLLSAVNTDCKATHRLTVTGRRTLELASTAKHINACMTQATLTLASMRMDFGTSFCAQLARNLPSLIERR